MRVREKRSGGASVEGWSVCDSLLLSFNTDIRTCPYFITSVSLKQACNGSASPTLMRFSKNQAGRHNINLLSSKLQYDPRARSSLLLIAIGRVQRLILSGLVLWAIANRPQS